MGRDGTELPPLPAGAGLDVYKRQIIDQQTFDLVQKIRGNVRRYPDGWGEAAPLTGLLYCAD